MKGNVTVKNAVQKSIYVDKSLFIRDILLSPDKVILFTRPTGFGKTHNMKMLQRFLEYSSDDASSCFRNAKVWSELDIRREQGRHPVIFISFDGLVEETWDATVSAIADVVADEYKRHTELADSPRLMDVDRMYYRKVLNGELSGGELRYSLRNLSKMLQAHHGRQCFIIVDGYDAPILSSLTYGFYEDAVRFMRLLFTEVLKTNEALDKGILTGIFRFPDILVELNMNVYSVFDSRFSQYFGLTEEEVEKIASDHNCDDKLEELSAWYGGYDFRETLIYNPWSVASYFKGDMRPALYWVNTGENSLLRGILENADPDIEENILRLMKGESVSTFIDSSYLCSHFNGSFSQVCSLLAATGYLKATNPTVVTNDVRLLCDVAIPNLEVSSVWKTLQDE